MDVRTLDLHLRERPPMDPAYRPRLRTDPVAAELRRLSMRLLALVPIALAALTVGLILAVGSPGPSPSPSPVLGRNGLLTYDKNGRVWGVQGDGSGAGQITFKSFAGGDHDAVWSPDGNRLAYWAEDLDKSISQTNTVERLMIKTARGEPVATTHRWSDASFGQEPHPTISWAPDNDRLAYTAWVPRGFGYSAILVIDPDVPDQFDEVAQRATDPSWAPAGETIAYLQSARVHLVMSDGTGDRVIYPRPAIAQPKWSPDGASLLITGSNTDRQEIVVADSISGSWMMVADQPTSKSPLGSAIWSPDGGAIAFLRRFPGEDGYRLAVLDVSGPEPRERFESAPVFLPRPIAWSPDGNLVAGWSKDAVDARSVGLTIVSLDQSDTNVFVPVLPIAEASGTSYALSWQRLVP
jgi:Tol biopolymer transport system component